MERHEYKVMFESENTHWWYVGLHELVCGFIDSKIGEKTAPRLLDAGCGTGRLLERAGVPGAVGLDYSATALGFCVERKLARLVRADIGSLPLPDGSFDMVVSLDVLYHRAVGSDQAALDEFARVLAPGGMLVLNLPAFNFLRSSHDRAIHTRERYTRAQLKRLLENAGFEIELLSYRNSILFPLAAVGRLLKKVIGAGGSAPESDIKPVNPLLSSLLTGILRFENRLLLGKTRLPWGLSVFAVARKAN